jgi:hypothetical protein
VRTAAPSTWTSSARATSDTRSGRAAGVAERDQAPFRRVSAAAKRGSRRNSDYVASDRSAPSVIHPELAHGLTTEQPRERTPGLSRGVRRGGAPHVKKDAPTSASRRDALSIERRRQQPNRIADRYWRALGLWPLRPCARRCHRRAAAASLSTAQALVVWKGKPGPEGAC